MKIEKQEVESIDVSICGWNGTNEFKEFKSKFGLTSNEAIAITLYYKKDRDIAHWQKQITESRISMMYADSAQARSWDQRDINNYIDYINAITTYMLDGE